MKKTIMIRESDKKRDDYDKYCVNGEEELDININGMETIITGDTYGG